MGNMDAISRQYRQRTGLDNVEEPETEPTLEVEPETEPTLEVEPETEPTLEVEPETELAKEVPAKPAPEAATKTK